jgi:single-stranded DNA-binding protein
MRQIVLDGRIGTGGAKVMQTAKGKSYIRFSLANDSFVNGTTKTEWFDVTCFDPFLVENKAKFMTQGRYVIVQGVPDSVVTNKDGKIYLNNYITATGIDLPSFGGKRDDNGEAQVSTFTGGTRSAEVVKPQPAPVQESVKAQAPASQPVPAPQPQVSVSQASPAGWSDGDDLPF